MTRITLTLLLAACGDDSSPGADSGTTRDGGSRDAAGSDAAGSDAGGGSDGGGSDGGGTDSGMRSMLSFFITSEGSGDGANLGGLDGADARCQMLADAVGAGDRMWRAYLSTNDPEINARDRIGAGPWVNADGDTIAADVDELHGDNNLDGMTGLTEAGDAVPGVGMDPNEHDILTGSTAEGMADPGSTCMDWTSNDGGNARLGHHDRMGGSPVTGMSWNSAHDSRGCSQSDLEGTGGAGFFYCFAAD